MVFDEDDKTFESDLLTIEGRYLLFKDLFEMWTHGQFWGDERSAGDDELAPHTRNEKTGVPETDRTNGTLLNLGQLKEHLNDHGFSFPTVLLPNASTLGLDGQVAGTDGSNQPVIPYQGLDIRMAKQCLEEWENADEFIEIDILIYGMVLKGYAESDICRTL